jgi:hypothetical protein
MPGPLEMLQQRFSNIRAHPFQNIASGVAGGLFPGAGLLANNIFNRYNQGQFNSSANQANQNLGDQIGQTSQGIFDRPLNGPLGQAQGGNDNAPLAQALSGGGQGGGMGGGYQGPQQSWNQGQNWQNQTGGSGGFLDFLTQGAPQTPNGSFFQDPQYQSHEGESGPQWRRDQAESGGGGGMPANYGVSNFNVGGSPVIFGVRPSGYDPNGQVYNNRKY